MKTSVYYPKKNNKTFIISLLIIFVFFALIFIFVQSKNSSTTLENQLSLEADNEEYPDTKQILSVQPVQQNVSLIAVGDFLLDRNVGRRMKEWNDYFYPIRNTKHILKSADITFCNVECPICEGREIGYTERAFRADPETVQTLVYGGFDIVSLANNHSMDFGGDCLAKTFDYLTEAGIKYVGAGTDYQDSHKAVVMEANGVKLAFLAYNDSDVVPDYYFSAEDRVGTNVMDTEQLKKDIEATKSGKFGEVDLIAVSMHSGTEYTPIPNIRQITFARAAIDFGADIVLGHHPHHVQHIEQYDDKFIIYSMGNFVLDQMAYPDCTKELLLNISLNKNNIHEVEVIPIRMKNFCETNVAVGHEKDEILQIINYETFQHNSIKYEDNEYKLFKRDILKDNSHKAKRKKYLHVDRKKEWKIVNEEKVIIAFFKKRLFAVYKDEIIWASRDNQAIADFETISDNKNLLLVSYWEESGGLNENKLEILKFEEGNVTSILKENFKSQPVVDIIAHDLDGDNQAEIVLSEGEYDDVLNDDFKGKGVYIYDLTDDNKLKLTKKFTDIKFDDIWINRNMIYTREL